MVVKVETVWTVVTVDSDSDYNFDGNNSTYNRKIMGNLENI